MKIILNGQTRELDDVVHLHHIVEKFRKDTRPVIAEWNGQIIKSPQWPGIKIKDGDIIELVNFVGGG